MSHPAVQRDPQNFEPRLTRRARTGSIFHALCFVATVVGVVVLGALLFDIVAAGGSRGTS